MSPVLQACANLPGPQRVFWEVFHNQVSRLVLVWNLPCGFGGVRGSPALDWIPQAPHGCYGGSGSSGHQSTMGAMWRCIGCMHTCLVYGDRFIETTVQKYRPCISTCHWMCHVAHTMCVYVRVCVCVHMNFIQLVHGYMALVAFQDGPLPFHLLRYGLHNRHQKCLHAFEYSICTNSRKNKGVQLFRYMCMTSTDRVYVGFCRSCTGFETANAPGRATSVSAQGRMNIGFLRRPISLCHGCFPG